MRFWKTVFNQTQSILAKTHPEYDANVENWEKYRLTFAGGTLFIDEYLNRFSPREKIGRAHV